MTSQREVSRGLARAAAQRTENFAGDAVHIAALDSPYESEERLSAKLNNTAAVRFGHGGPAQESCSADRLPAVLQSAPTAAFADPFGAETAGRWGLPQPTAPAVRAVGARGTPLHAGERAIRTLLVGTGKRALRAARALSEEGSRRILVGCADIAQQPDLIAAMPALPWLGGLERLAQIVHDHGVDEMHVALPVKSCFEHWVAVQAVGRELGVPVAFDLDLFDGVPARDLSIHPDRLVLSCHRHPARRFQARARKRALDVTLALLSIVGLAPLLVVAAAAVKLQSRGPLFFRQPRLGLGRRPFYMLKFRTMVDNAEELRSDIADLNEAHGPLFKIEHDPRVTSVGRILRRTSIDELPQLFNVLRGDMSLVGPRPLPVEDYEKLAQPLCHRRFAVLPGMTGSWQVNGRVQDFAVMARHDLQYVDEWSHQLDCKILFATIPVVLRGADRI